MAEIKPEGSGHKTIKLTPVGTTPENEGVGTSTVKVGRAVQKPQAPAEDLEKTQAIPLKKLKPLAAKPVDSPFGKKLKLGGTTQALSPKKEETATKGIPLSGISSVPKTAVDDGDLTATVRLNRPAPKTMSTQSTPISTKSVPLTVGARSAVASPLGAQPPVADAAPSLKSAAASPKVGTATTGIKVGTATTSIHLGAKPAQKIGHGAGASTSTTGIKIGTATTSIHLGAKPTPGAATIKLVPPQPAEEDAAESAQTVKIGGVAMPGASTVKLKSPVVPAAPAEAPEVDKVDELVPAPVAEESAVEEEPAAVLPADEEPIAEESAPLEDSSEEIAEDANGKSEFKLPDYNVAGTPAPKAHWLFTVTSFVALICLIVWVLLAAVQFLNHWQGMDIQLPGLTFLSAGK